MTIPDQQPLLAALERLLRQRRNGVSEYELLAALRRDALLPGQSDVLTLFRAHFRLMNALYQLQPIFFREGLWLRIEPLRIALEAGAANQGDSGPKTARFPGTASSDAALAAWYLDWENYVHTGADEVVDLLSGFWRRYNGHEQRDAALAELELSADADWPAIQHRYRQLAAEHHPDRGGSATRFNRVRQAYESLRSAR